MSCKVLAEYILENHNGNLGRHHDDDTDKSHSERLAACIGEVKEACVALCRGGGYVVIEVLGACNNGGSNVCKNHEQSEHEIVVARLCGNEHSDKSAGLLVLDGTGKTSCSLVKIRNTAEHYAKVYEHKHAVDYVSVVYGCAHLLCYENLGKVHGELTGGEACENAGLNNIEEEDKETDDTYESRTLENVEVNELLRRIFTKS